MLVPLPPSLPPFLGPYLPRDVGRTFVTLTYAQSLDSMIAAKPGTQTKISHLETKTMTHYLRSKHSGILVGIGTVLADDPKLNCRFESGQSPRPIVLDPDSKWVYSKSQLYQICKAGQGLAPYILIDTTTDIDEKEQQELNGQGGKFIRLDLKLSRADNWKIILAKLYQLGIESVMIEGGAKIINELLVYKTPVVDSLIITVGPVFLGEQGVQVSPKSQTELKNVKWWSGVQDSVVCANV